MAKRQTTLRVTGLKETMSALRALPDRARKSVMKSSVSKASTPIVKEARKLVPLGSGLKPDGTPREHLRKTITKTSAKIYKNGSVVVTIGPGFRKAPHSHLVDKGTKPHDIKLTKTWIWNSTKFSRKFLFKPGKVLKHPGAKAVHFMDRAVAMAGDRSKTILETSIAKGIEKEAAKLAGKK